MTRLLGSVFVHPWFISFLNLLFTFNLFHAVLEMRLSSLSEREEVVGIIEGLGIIMIAWGVALEERHKLREIFHVIPKKNRLEINYQNAIDENCHRFGLGFLLLGLFAEVGAACVDIPDRIINTQHLEGAVLSLSGFCLVLCGILLMSQTAILLFTSRNWLIRRYQTGSVT